jgi:CheY-like chemotaxis protein
VQVLVIDDNPDDAELTAEALTGVCPPGATRVCHAAEDALRCLRSGLSTDDGPRLPRLILLDINMPQMSGLDFLRILKSDERMRHIPVVMLTTSDEESDIVASYALGSNGYIVKAFELSALKEDMRKAGAYWLEVNQLPRSGRGGGNAR